MNICICIYILCIYVILEIDARQRRAIKVSGTRGYTWTSVFFEKYRCLKTWKLENWIWCFGWVLQYELLYRISYEIQWKQSVRMNSLQNYVLFVSSIRKRNIYYIYTYIYTNIYTNIYIYEGREREREKGKKEQTTCLYVYNYLYIHLGP